MFLLTLPPLTDSWHVAGLASSLYLHQVLVVDGEEEQEQVNIVYIVYIYRARLSHRLALSCLGLLLHKAVPTSSLSMVSSLIWIEMYPAMQLIN